MQKVDAKANCRGRNRRGMPKVVHRGLQRGGREAEAARVSRSGGVAEGAAHGGQGGVQKGLQR